MIEPSRPAGSAHRTVLGAARIAALAGVTLAAMAMPSRAAEPPYRPAPAYGSDADGSVARPLTLSVGRSVVVDLPRDAKEVFVANPAVANAVVRSTRKIFLIGVANGATSVFVMDAEGRQIASLEVNVGRDLNVLRQTLRGALPSARIDVKAAGDSILLTGHVAAASDAQQASDIAKAFVGQTAVGGTAGAAGAAATPASLVSGGVINALVIDGRDQVMLKVTVVEMARSTLKQLGINVSGSWSATEIASAFASGGMSAITGALGATGADISGSVTRTTSGRNGTRSSTVGGTLQALEQAGVARILAEPTLVAISGESATFQAGGEIPIVINSCTAGSGSGTQCVPTVSYKPYGVALSFTPIVLSEGRISLRVSTEVSEIDRDNQDVTTKTPAFRTRRSTTTVELPSGASMVTAGLISSQTSQTISGVPGLINLPILGALFRSRDFQRRDSELMLMVTPYIAKPMESAQVVRPDDNFHDASDPNTLLLGRLNRLYGVAGPARPGGLSNGFGFITD